MTQEEKKAAYKLKKEQKKARWRANKGEEYFVYILKDENASMYEFKVNKRIENESRIDSLYHEIGNYFQTEQECINELKKYEK